MIFTFSMVIWPSHNWTAVPFSAVFSMVPFLNAIWYAVAGLKYTTASSSKLPDSVWLLRSTVRLSKILYLAGVSSICCVTMTSSSRVSVTFSSPRIQRRASKKSVNSQWESFQSTETTGSWFSTALEKVAMAAAVLDGVTGAGALDGVTALEEVAVCAGSALRVPVSGSKLLFDA